MHEAHYLKQQRVPTAEYAVAMCIYINLFIYRFIWIYSGMCDSL